MKKIGSNYLWVEKYRPQTIDDVIIPDAFKATLKKWVDDGEISNFGMFGAAGLGKGSVYGSLLNDMNADRIVINASKDNGIDTLRTTISRFASSKSFENKIKIVVLDESDYITSNAQSAFRNDIESFSSNARFIFTGNEKEKIIPPILNRLQVFDLDKIFEENTKELKEKIFFRLKFILENENVEFDLKDLQEVVKTQYPSIRGMINYLSQNSTTGRFLLTSPQTEKYSQILQAVNDKNFNELKKLVNNIDTPEMFYKWVYQNIDTIIPKVEQRVSFIPLLAQYQDMNGRAIMKTIPLLAFLVDCFDKVTFEVKK